MFSVRKSWSVTMFSIHDARSVTMFPNRNARSITMFDIRNARSVTMFLHNNVPLMTHGQEPYCFFSWAMDGDNRIPNNVFRVADGVLRKLQFGNRNFL